MNMDAGIISDSLKGLLGRIFLGLIHLLYVDAKRPARWSWGRICVLKETDGMDEINLLFLIVVIFSE